MGFVWVYVESFLHSVASSFHYFVTTDSQQCQVNVLMGFVWESIPLNYITPYYKGSNEAFLVRGSRKGYVRDAYPFMQGVGEGNHLHRRRPHHKDILRSPYAFGTMTVRMSLRQGTVRGLWGDSSPVLTERLERGPTKDPSILLVPAICRPACCWC